MHQLTVRQNTHTRTHTPVSNAAGPERAHIKELLCRRAAFQ